MQHEQFSGPLAKVIFQEEVSTERAQRDAKSVERFARWIQMTSTNQAAILSRGPAIDAMLVRYLSLDSLRSVACMIEERCPDALAQMPILRRHLAFLANAATLSGIFEASHLAALARALQIEVEG